MERFDQCTDAFKESASRAREMISLFEALEMLRKEDINSDALRAAWIQAVSSFDFYVHELVIIEAKHRLSSSIKTRNIQVPMEIAVMPKEKDRIDAFEAYIRQANSYKAFVAPDKLAQIISCFTDKPWKKIEENYNACNEEQRSQDQLKESLKEVWNRRNKIAHEADINPAFSSTQLWPIYKEDVEFTVQVVESIGACLPQVINEGLD